MTTTLLTLRQRLRQSIGDGFREALTTALTTSTAVVSTNLNKWDGTADDFFNDWFIYIEDYLNEGVSRVLSDYATSGGSCTARGASFLSDTANKATVMFTTINPDHYLLAIQRAVRKMDGILYAPLNDMTLITNNYLPNSSFEDWTLTTYPDLWGVTNATAAQTTTAGLYWGPRGTSSALVTTTAADGYMYLTSKVYPKLLDLQNQVISVYGYAYPSVANDAFLTIYTVSNDGTTTQDVSSTTTCAASQWTLLKKEDQAINDDLTYLEIRCRVHTSLATCYFDNVYVSGVPVLEYLMPKDFYNGEVHDVRIQTDGLSSESPANDLHIRSEQKVYPKPEIINDGTYKFLRFDRYFPSEYRIHLLGQKPLETLTDYDDTISVDDPALELVIAQAIAELGKIERSDELIALGEYEVAQLKGNYKMATPPTIAKTR